MISRHLIILSLAGLAGAAALAGSNPATSLTALAQSVLGPGMIQPQLKMPVFARAGDDDDIPRDFATPVSQFTPANGKRPPCAHNINGGIRLQMILFIRPKTDQYPFGL